MSLAAITACALLMANTAYVGANFELPWQAGPSNWDVGSTGGPSPIAEYGSSLNRLCMRGKHEPPSICGFPRGDGLAILPGNCCSDVQIPYISRQGNDMCVHWCCFPHVSSVRLCNIGAVCASYASRVGLCYIGDVVVLCCVALCCIVLCSLLCCVTLCHFV